MNFIIYTINNRVSQLLITMINSSINKLNIAKAFFLLFLASLFFPIRYVFPTKDAFETGAYSDFTSISLYLSDIFLFLAAGFAFLPRGGMILPRGETLPPRGGIFACWLRIKDKGLWILILWLTLGLFWHFKTLSEINWWFTLKYAELIVAYGTTYYLFSKTTIKQAFYSIFLILASFQSILAIWQFIIQKSIGLGKIGEQLLSPDIIGVAKIVSSGTKLIRGYGTFPHPNLLSAFLALGIIIALYLLIKTTKKYQKTVYSAALFINIIGLTVTFSRAGFLAAGFGVLTLLAIFVYKYRKTEKNITLFAIFVVLISCIISFLIFKPYLLTRTTISDQASLERIFYAKTAWQMIKHQPFMGIGIGESVIHMQQYSPIKLWPWQIQPVHNFFLLSAAELGIPGMLILVWIFLSHLKTLNNKLTGGYTTKYLLLAIFICFLILMQFDHYFYTLQQTQMLLWILLGMITAETKTPQAGEL